MLDGPWQIVVWIGALLGLVYLFFAIYTIIVLFDFREKLRKRLVALSVLFAEKKEILLSLYGLFHKAKLPLNAEIIALRDQVAGLNTEVTNEKQVLAAVALLNDFQRHLLLLAEDERYIQKSPDFTSYANFLKDLENNYHRIVAAYNTDLNGYEYWRKRAIYIWLTWIFGFRKRQRLV
jgi:sulfur carrier protein ThiS